MDHRTIRHEGALKDTFSSKKFKMLRNQFHFQSDNLFLVLVNLETLVRNIEIYLETWTFNKMISGTDNLSH